MIKSTKLVFMDEHKLLTSGQRDHYRMMKANHQPDVEKSEYLIDCLRKGESGFLQRLCTILKTLPPSSYIAEILTSLTTLSLREATCGGAHAVLFESCTSTSFNFLREA